MSREGGRAAHPSTVPAETVSIFPSYSAGIAVTLLVALASFIAGAVCAVVLQQGTCQDIQSASLWNPLAAFRGVQAAAMNPVLAVLSPHFLFKRASQ